MQPWLVDEGIVSANALKNTFKNTAHTENGAADGGWSPHFSSLSNNQCIFTGVER